MDYCEFSCKQTCLSSVSKDILTAFLSEVGFESFIEDDDCFKAYIQADSFGKQAFDETINEAAPLLGSITYSVSKIPAQDWNKTWEDTFEYVEISDSLLVRTPDYQPAKHYQHEIVISPEMAFGSGTHETTAQILQAMQQIDFNGIAVADCGCGTGVLGVFAALLGAKHVFCFDNDPFCVENTKKNIALNNLANVQVELADLGALDDKHFDIVIANINRNILTENMERIAKASRNRVILSGFYADDLPIIQKAAEAHGLQLQGSLVKNNWCVTTFIRI